MAVLWKISRPGCVAGSMGMYIPFSPLRQRSYKSCCSARVRSWPVMGRSRPNLALKSARSFLTLPLYWLISPGGDFSTSGFSVDVADAGLGISIGAEELPEDFGVGSVSPPSFLSMRLGPLFSESRRESTPSLSHSVSTAT